MKSGEEQDGRDSKVVGAYRAASDALDERPSAAVRAAILAAAARAVDAQPRDAQTGATARRAPVRNAGWNALAKRPLAAVASFLVATVALVLATNVEREPAELASKVATAPTQTEAARTQRKVEQAAPAPDADVISMPARSNEAARPDATLERAFAERDAARRVDATPRAKVAPGPDAAPAAAPESIAQAQRVPAAPPAASPAPSPDASLRLAPAPAVPAAPAAERKLTERRELAKSTLGDTSTLNAAPPPAQQAVAPLSGLAAKTDAVAPAPSIAAVTPAPAVSGQPSAGTALPARSSSEPSAPASSAPSTPSAPATSVPPAPALASSPSAAQSGSSASTVGAVSPSRAANAGGVAASRETSEAEGRARQEAQAGKPAADRAAEPARDVLDKAAPAKLREPGVMPSETRARHFAATPPADRSIALEREVEGDPARWVQRIAALRDAGLDADADRELARLRERYPKFEVPANALRRAGTR